MYGRAYIYTGNYDASNLPFTVKLTVYIHLMNEA